MGRLARQPFNLIDCNDTTFRLELKTSSTNNQPSMHEHPNPTITEHSPFFAPTIPPEQQRTLRQGERAVTEAASRQAAEREQSYLAALNGPPGVQPLKLRPLRQPLLPADFAEQIAALDEKIFERGVAMSRERLLSLGQERFKDLLCKDRAARSLQRVIFTDLSSWFSVQQAFLAAGAFATAVPKRKTSEVARGVGEDRERAATINGFSDLWKASQEPQVVRDVYAFHEAFVTLALGQSILEQLSRDGRLRSRLFCGGRIGATTSYFRSWLATLEGPHFKVTVASPLWHILAWLTNEHTPLLEPAEQAKELFGVRAPSRAQIKLCDALMQGFLLGLRSWDLWNYVGRVTRQLIQHRDLEIWCNDLAKRYPAIAQFHDVLRDYFWQSVGAGSVYHAHRVFDSARYHSYLDHSLGRLLDCVSAIAALAVEGTCVARFSDWLLLEGKPKPKLADTISEKLETAFAGQSFQVNVEEVR